MDQVYFHLSVKSRRKLLKVKNLDCSKYDLTHLSRIFNQMLKNARLIKSYKRNKSIKILKMLDKVIPDEYFGNGHHRKRFYKVVKLILTQSVGECVYTSLLTKGYSCNAVPWLRNISNSHCEMLLGEANIWVLDAVVKPLISFYYKPLKTCNGHELQFVWLSDWCSFQARALAYLKKSGALVEAEESRGDEARGYMNAIPKGPLSELKFRPIASSLHTDNSRFLKYLVKKIYAAARDMKNNSSSLYEQWVSFLERAAGKEIHGVKMDVEDAFGNVEINGLVKLIERTSTRFLSNREKKFLVNYVQNQIVFFQRKLYQCNRGLIQGDVLSAALCELYMTYYDTQYLGNWGDDSFFHRIVDDYFFCSIDSSKVRDFENHLQKVHTINTKKTVSTLYHHHEVPYCGKIFNFKTKEVRNLYNFKDGFEIRHKFKLWNVRRPIPQSNAREFFTKSLTFSLISTCLSKMQLNTVFNSQRTVLENFFDAMVYVAYKCDATITALRRTEEDFDYVYDFVMKYIKQCAFKARKVMLLNKGSLWKKKISFRLLKIIALKAFLVVLRLRNYIYKGLILKIKNENYLRMDFTHFDIDVTYFQQLPASFRKVKISRKVGI